ncbi:MAG: HDOD domain-containing protein [Nitrosomonadales bacterium]|nr:HDOD domain-containing protein [Nitrosomonadales bacterium]
MPAQRIGRFEILSELGKGGQGMVYLAYDPQLDRKVAIKTLRNLTHKAEQLTHEALIVSKLQHPNIITLHDAGQDQGVPYLIYAYIEGKTLAQTLKQEKTLPQVRAAEIICGVLEGLSYAHAQGICHLDMKPANVMISNAGLPMIMDFGLAKTVSALEQPHDATLNGTPRYVAPELISGKRGDFLSDIYSVGTMLYEMVTGEYAVSGHNIYEVLNRAAHENIAAPSTRNKLIDKKLESIILRAVAKDPRERYLSALVMKQELQDYLKEKRNATTEFLLHRMRSKQDFPALSSVISEINKITASESESISKLAGIILQDLALTNKLLKLVNAATYGQFGGTINTVSKAVVILGFETVRNIAMSLILLELLQNKAQAAQLKDEIIKAVFSGVVATQLSAKHELLDTEEVLVCSMFHNLGKLLSIYYFFEESQEIASLIAQGESETKATVKVLGVSYDDLGSSVAQSWNFPPRLIAGMRKIDSKNLPSSHGALDDLAVTVNMAHELCEISAASQVQDKQQLLRDLAKRYEEAAQVSEQDLSSAISVGLHELSYRTAILGINTSNSTLLSRVRDWSGHALPGKTAKQDDSLDGVTKLDQKVTEQEVLDQQINARPLNSEAILSAGIQDITNSMVGDYNLNDILQIALETMYRGMGFGRALIMIRNNKQGRMLARFGFGTGINEIIPHFHFPLPFTPDVFHLSIEKGLDIAIADIHALNISDKIPGWYRDTINAPCFILLPLMLNGKAIGLFYADMIEANALDISQQQLGLLRTLRNQAVLAIKQKT